MLRSHCSHEFGMLRKGSSNESIWKRRLTQATNRECNASMCQSFWTIILARQSSVAVAKLAPRVIPVLHRLQAASQSQKWRDLVREWNAHQTILAQRKSAQRFAALAQTWKERNDAWDRVLELLGQPVGKDGSLAAAWGRLRQLGGHPESDGYRSRIDPLLERERSWSEFKKAPRNANAAADVRLVNAWNEGVQGMGFSRTQATGGRTLASSARTRAATTPAHFTKAGLPDRKTNRRIGPGNSTTLPRSVGQPCPAGSTTRVSAIRHLRFALKEPVSDLKVVEDLPANRSTAGTGVNNPSPKPKDCFGRTTWSDPCPVAGNIPADYAVSQAPQWDAKLLWHWQEDLLRPARTPSRGCRAISKQGCAINFWGIFNPQLRPQTR